MAGLRDHQKHRHDNFEYAFRHGKANCTIFGSGHPNSIHVSGCMTSYTRKHHSGPAHFACIVGNPEVALGRDLLAAELGICWKFPQYPRTTASQVGQGLRSRPRRRWPLIYSFFKRPSQPVASVSVRVPPSQFFIEMYGPPRSCKRKTKNGGWSAPMYSSFGGVRDSGP